MISTILNKVKECFTKWISRNKISKEWAKYVVNEFAVPGKNSTLYKTHKPNNPVRLLTTVCNIAIEILSRFIEVHTFQPLRCPKREVYNEAQCLPEVAPWLPPKRKFWILAPLKVWKMHSPGSLRS